METYSIEVNTTLHCLEHPSHLVILKTCNRTHHFYCAGPGDPMFGHRPSWVLTNNPSTVHTSEGLPCTCPVDAVVTVYEG